MPINAAVGVRYEQTDVTSSALVPSPIRHQLGLGQRVLRAVRAPGITTLEGDYDYVLPSLDFEIGLTDNLKSRASWGKSIGRPGWGDIQGGQTLDQLVRINGGTGSQGNPALKPLESTNFDLSLEWYYAEGSYASVGYFRKDIDNYIGVTHDRRVSRSSCLIPVRARYFNEAVAAACADGDLTCIRNYIFDNHAGDPGVAARAWIRTATASASSPASPATRSPSSASPCRQPALGDSRWLGIHRPAHVRRQRLRRLGELHDGRLGPEVRQPDSRRAVRARRPERCGERRRVLREVQVAGPRGVQLARRVPGGTLRWHRLPNPVYTEPYGQVDLNVSYQWSDNLTLRRRRSTSRTRSSACTAAPSSEVLFVTQTGPRYMIGARYKFGWPVTRAEQAS